MRKNIIQISYTFFVMGILFGCHEHDAFLSPHHENVTAEFDSANIAIHENEVQQSIRLSFSKPMPEEGWMSLSVSPAMPSRYTLEPATSSGQINLFLERNAQSAAIKINPINNTLVDGNLEFTITISCSSSGLRIGERKSVVIKLSDDDSTAPAQHAIADFIETDKHVSETGAGGKTYSIKLSQALTAPGSIELSLESTTAVYGTHFITEPGFTNGKVILHPAIGDDKVNLTVVPINNSILTGELEMILRVTGTTGSIIKGTQLSQAVIIVDDEVTNRPKGYELSGGLWGLKKTYEYDESGKIKHVLIEKSTPATSTHTENYIYDAAGRIQSINTYPQIDIVYTWANERIIKSEAIEYGVVKEYISYDYDAQGNVSGTANYFRQQDGQFKLGFLTIYLYFMDNNLYKSQTYIPAVGQGSQTLISTRTYDHYIDKENPFPMVEILPTTKTQNRLPSTYTVEENGMTLQYALSYEFRADGRVSKRIAISGNLIETSNYQYY